MLKTLRQKKHILIPAALTLAGIAVLLVFIILAVKPIRERLSYRFEQISTRIFYIFFPPEKAVFKPEDQQQTAVAGTLTAIAMITPTSAPATPIPTGMPSATPTLTPTPLPGSVRLSGVRYMDQHGVWNYCAPANLAMLLSYWGWEGDRMDTGRWLKPFEKDKNVMPYEMADYVREETSLGVIVRSGGTIELLKALLAGGYPVLVEKGTYIRETTTGKISWMGHYSVLTGYDDTKGEFNTQDSFYSPDYPVSYDTLLQEWRSFNYVFLVVYSQDRERHLLTLLGDYADERKSEEIAAQRASQEIYTQSGNDQFFAWFNRGTSLVRLQDYYSAAAAYDQAFLLYETLPESTRPFRIVWYQTGPYFAYYYTGRYQDVINLATTVLEATYEPYLEESFYWRASARIALGDQQGAIEDLCQSLKYHPNFIPSTDRLGQLGISNCP
ncbi:MAG: hypothetical protein HPY45_00460 [Anaerolineae bacterium]|nr:hypothetical protein [Anaerolineae bacterium]